MISEDYDHRWEALAEVHFNTEDDLSEENYIYCLCSRVFIRDGVKLYMVEREEGSESEVEVLRDSNIQETDDHSHVHFSVNTSYKVKCEKDEGASCYCSASHTDNYCSTDEHDPAQLQTSSLNMLQPSDSGADLTYQESHSDYPALDKLEKMDQDHPSQNITEFEENYLSESTWDKFWSVNGERIIWASWIKQYSDYINPAYLDENNDLIMEENIPRDNSADQIPNIKNSTNKEEDYDYMRERKFSYDSKVNPYKKGRMSSESSAEKANNMKSNELISNRDQAWLPIGGRRRSCSEHDRIMSPRTVPGTDSMTNVTKITLSSYDVTSSHATSVSTPTDEYSVSSSTSDDPSNDQTRIANLEENLETQTDEMDMDQSWQFLWKKHFGEQYAMHYSSYLECQSDVASKNTNVHTGVTEILKDKIEIDYENSDGNSQEMPSVIEVQNQVEKIQLEEKPRPKKKNKKSSNKYIGSVGMLLQNLLKEEQQKTDLEDVVEAGDESSDRKDTPPVDTVDGPTTDTMVPAVNYDNYYTGSYEDDEDDKPPEERPVTLKRSHEIDAEELASERIRTTFRQMGLNMDPAAVVRGQLVYRKRFIRPPKPRGKKPGLARKTYFDDDGNARVDQPQDSDEEKEMQTDDEDDVGSDSDARQSQDKPQRMVTESETNKPAGSHDNRDVSQAADPNVSSHHDNQDAPTNKPKRCHGNDDEVPPREMSTECATNVPTRPEACRDERELVVEAATVPLPPEVDSDGQGTDGLEKSGEDVLESVDAAPGEATRRRRRKRRRSAGAGDDALVMPADLQRHPNMKKYWKKRHSLFHRFDEGIQLDLESWFSVTPEKVAKHIAEKCRCDLIVDAFCGAGGNAIQFAWTCERVIAIDIDPAKIELARHNAAVYGVADRIEFLVGDFFALAPRLKADVVFLSPPWGGPKYVEKSQYDLESMLEPKPASELMAAAQAISSDVAIYVPRNSRSEQLVSLAKYSGAVEIEQNFLGRRFVALTAYYGELVNY